MLKQDIQEKYQNKIWSSMRAHLRRFCRYQKPEDLHQLRVSMKKIRATMTLYPKHIKNKLEKHYRPVWKIFKHAGIIRSANIFLELDNDHNTAICKQQQKIRKDETKKFSLNYERYSKTIKKTRSYFLHHLENIKDKDILLTYEKKLKKLTGFFAKPNNDIDKLHKTRKKIKSLLYVYKILHTRLTKKIQLNTAYLAKLENHIGELHDIHLTIQLLQTNESANKNVIAKLQRKSDNMLRTIHRQTDKFAENVRLPKNLVTD